MKQPELISMLKRLKHVLRRIKLYREFSEFRQWRRDYRHLNRERLHWILQYHEIQQGGKVSYERKLPLNCDGLPHPWITYGALDYLLQFDFSTCQIFEYGSGNSSQFWAKRCRQLISVESDEKWAASNRQAALPNQRLVYARDEHSYASCIAKFDTKFEVIVIDGDFRPACAIAALPYLAENGMILFDNSDWFPKTVAFLASKGLTQIDFVGPGPINNYLWATSLFLGQHFRIPRAQRNGQILITGGLGHKLDDEVNFENELP